LEKIIAKKGYPCAAKAISFKSCASTEIEALALGFDTDNLTPNKDQILQIKTKIK
jgi:hypothetical protein